ncbi:MAG: hypothetical protein FMNOHCHN_00694 [Ignavibacteriaceae bacterium]|nr:hypothetical protein [Ignavibacteriaceae bacterium]
MSDHKIADDIKNTVKEGIEKIERIRSRFHKSVNFFIGIFVFFFTVFLILLSASQTSTFREILLGYIVDAVNESANGKLSVGSLEGSLFTSIELRDVLLTEKTDTAAYAGLVAVRISPFRIFQKRIAIKEITVQNADIRMSTDSSGTLNFARIFPPTSEEDTTESDFPFTIVLERLDLSGVDFTYTDFRSGKFSSAYDTLNLNDVKIRDLELSLNSKVDIDRNSYEAEIKNLAFRSNITGLDVEHISVRARIDTNGAVLSDLNLRTTRSDLSLNMILADFNFFGEFELPVFSAAPIYLGLYASKFNFDDLRAFLPSVDMLKGELAGDIMAKGTLDQLEVKKLDLSYRNTLLKTQGMLYNLTNPNLLTIDAAITNSFISETDVPYLLPLYPIPKMEYFDNVGIDTISYKGTPWDFKTYASLRVKKGKVRANFDLNINGPQPVYAVKTELRDMNITPLTGYPLILNVNLKGNGSSFDPDSMAAAMEGELFSSVIGRKRFEQITLRGSIKDQSLLIETSGSADPDSFKLTLGTYFPEDEEPYYNLNLDYKNLDIAGYIPDSSALSSDLTFQIDAEGSSFDLEKLNGSLKVNLQESEFMDDTLQNIYASLKITSKEDSYKKLELLSSVGKVVIEGKVNIADAGMEIVRHVDTLVATFKGLALRYFPDEFAEIVEQAGTDIKKNFQKRLTKPDAAPPAEYPVFDVKYTINSVDLRPIAIFLRNRDATFEGEVTGSIKNEKEGFELTSRVALPFFRMWNGDEVNFVSDAEIDFAFKQDNAKSGISAVKASLDASAGRVYIGTEYNNLFVKAGIKDEKLSLAAGLQSKAPKLSAGLESEVDLTNSIIKFDISRLEFSYNDFEVRNQQPMSIGIQKSSVRFNNFNLSRGYTRLFVNGLMQLDGYQDLDLLISNFRGYDLSNAILGLPPEEGVDFDMNLRGSIEGSFNNPRAQFTVTADSVTYQGRNFGSLKSLFDYSNKLLKADLRFIDLKNTFENARLKISAFLPLDLALNAEGDRLPENKAVRLRLLADEFNLAAFGNSLPFLNELRGILNADVSIAGNYANLEKTGYFNVSDGYFVLQNNNLPYEATVKMKLDGNYILLDRFTLTNAGRVKNKGTMEGSGRINIDGYSVDSMLFTFNGNLSVLSEDSRAVLPAVYGDLFLETKGPVTFTRAAGVSALSASILVTEGNLIFPPTQSAYSSSADNFIYKYFDNNPEITRRDQEIQDLLNTQRIRRRSTGTVQQAAADFDFNVGIEIKTEASINFVFSAEANQSLLARLGGGLIIERRKGIQSIQGELELQDGSNLKLIKTFNAEGKLRFESEITNPYLDITALYKDYYTPPDTASATVKEEEVAVKVILKGPLSDLSKTFTQMENNIAVYKGKTNIDNNTPSPEYDKADAIWFIVTGKFKNDLTAQEKTKTTQFLGVDATSVAGSLLGGLLTAYLGDYVRSFEFRNVGAATKFNLSGKYKDLRYTIGGSTNVFQDFSTANVRIEYPIIQNFLIRIERRESSTETNYTNEMINELGLKYRFEF